MALNSLVFTMAFHTYLAHVVAKENNVPMGTGLLFSSRRKTPLKDKSPMKLKKAKRLNSAAKVISAIAIGFFNVIFWMVAMYEYVKSADDYL